MWFWCVFDVCFIPGTSTQYLVTCLWYPAEPEVLPAARRRLWYAELIPERRQRYPHWRLPWSGQCGARVFWPVHTLFGMSTQYLYHIWKIPGPPYSGDFSTMRVKAQWRPQAGKRDTKNIAKQYFLCLSKYNKTWFSIFKLDLSQFHHDQSQGGPE